jgi:hypothetical protein
MVTNRKAHHLVDFAARFTQSYLPTLNAHTAIWRLEALIIDIERLQEVFEASQLHDGAPNLGSGFEVLDYFSVGFVTCLEWHARSRLVDLLRHRPESIETNDVQRLDKAVLVQMTAAAVTLPHIVGAGTKVSSIKEYLAVFDRIFQALVINTKVEATLRAYQIQKYYWDENETISLYETIADLFEKRNELVHEVGPNVAAHHSLRERWSLEEALRFGRATLECVKNVESIFTASAPKDFPNLIDKDGTPVDELTRLEKETKLLENAITEELKDDHDSLLYWRRSTSAYQSYLAKERKFLDSADFLRPLRQLDFAQPLRISLLQGRFSFLSSLHKECSSADT